jgi:hypothetical protein
MKKLLLIVPLALVLGACSRNPDPEYAPASDDAAAPAAVPQAAPVAALAEEEAMRLGREAVQLMFDDDVETLWTRFDADVQAQAGSVDNFRGMMQQIFGQIGAEMNVVEEEIVTPEEQPGLRIYRRRSTYIALGSDADLFVAFNADGTIGGINIRPAE